MKVNTIAALIVTTYIGLVYRPRLRSSAGIQPEQEARIGEIAANYLVAHPEILVTVSQKTSGSAAGTEAEDVCTQRDG